MRRNNVNASPERQRKIALVTAALERRGLQPNYRGLRPAGDGTWAVGTKPLPGRPVVEPLADGWYVLQGDDFDELLALISDDLLLARYLYQARSEDELRVRQALREAERQLRRAKDDYARAAVDLVLSAIDNGGVPVGQEEHGKACHEAYAKLALARGVERQAREEFDAYHAAVPTTQEEAAAYLAGLPTVVRD